MKNSPIKICPSILAGDFGYIADEARKIEASGAEWLHVDVMDGHFVPNLTVGPQVVEAINRATNMFLDVHLMMYNPFDYIERFVKAGADMITFHFEATEDVEDTLAFIRKCNVRAGLAFCPETSMSLIPRFLPLCDLVLLMTVPPGFGGQSFQKPILDKIQFTRHVCNTLGIRSGGVIQDETAKEVLPPFDIQVDGGINLETAKLAAEAGATVFVAGTALFSNPDLAEAVTEMRETVRGAFVEKVVPNKVSEEEID